MTRKTQRILDIAAIAFVAGVIGFSMFVCLHAPTPITITDLVRGAWREATGRPFADATHVDADRIVPPK